MVRPIPEGYHSVTPYLTVDDADAAIRWYGAAFGAVETLRLPMDGKIGHAQIRIGDSPIMLSDEWPTLDKLGPRARGGATAAFRIYVEDVDSAFARAIAAGGTEVRAVQDQFYGDRAGTLADPFGHEWTLASHVEDVGEAELKRRMAALPAG